MRKSFFSRRKSVFCVFESKAKQRKVVLVLNGDVFFCCEISNFEVFSFREALKANSLNWSTLQFRPRVFEARGFSSISVLRNWATIFEFRSVFTKHWKQNPLNYDSIQT